LGDPEACSRKARGKLPKPAAKRDTLDREQLRPWFAEVRKLSPTVAAFLQTALLTGARREELLSLRWEDVDFRWNSLCISDKVEGQRTIPLTPYVAALLRDLKARNETPPKRPVKLRGRAGEPTPKWKPSPWVFASSTAASGHLKEPRAAHVRALTAAGLPHLSIHGLRRSFGTLAEWCEVPVGIVAQIQGHKPSAIAEKHYRVRPLDLLRSWHERIEAWILAEAGIEQPKATPVLRVVGAAER
jgi:integrase